MKRRIVSLVPSLSETVVAAGMRDELVGCTQFCVEPSDLHRTAQVVGGTKDFDLDKIRALSPTHILANQEENPKELIELLQKGFPLLLTFPKSPFDVPGMLRAMDIFLATSHVYGAFAVELEALFVHACKNQHSENFLYFIWREPYMLAGRDTYISRFLEAFGWVNAYEGETRYPQMSLEELKKLDVSKYFFSTEPYPFRKRDAKRLREAWPDCPEILKIDGRLMSWYGSATIEAWKAIQAALGKEPPTDRGIISQL